MQSRAFSLILLDIRLPGIDGIQVLDRLRESRPEIPVIMMSAHGTIASAVDAMKLGAIEFLEKPCLPADVRTIVTRVLRRGELREAEADDYATYFELAKRCLSERHAAAAIEHLRKGISISPERPEAYNLLGAIHELRHETREALNNYRVAWNYDAAYEPSRLNIERLTGSHPRKTPILLGDLREEAPKSLIND